MTVRRWLVAALTIAVFGVLVAPAQAVYHFMKVREIHTGTTGDYVELQMYSSGQNQVQGHSIRTYDSAGNLVSNVLLSNPVPNGQNQRTILIASTTTVGAPPDFTNAALDVNSGSGSVCFYDDPLSTGIDCVSYGTAAPPTGNPSPVGTPAASLAQGQSLERSIARGCATLLENSDDTNDSAADFAVAAPSPRPNSVAPTETECTGGGGSGGGGGGGGDNNPPETKIDKAPDKKSEKTTAKFKFSSSEQGSSFKCRLDKKRFKDCTSPRKYKRLDEGKHKFKVFATDRAGNADKSPAKYRFKVVD